MKSITHFFQVALLRLTLSTPRYANVIGGFCLALVGLTVGLEDVLDTIHIYKAITLKHVSLAVNSCGAALTKFAVKHPQHLNALVDTLNKAS